MTPHGGPFHCDDSTGTWQIVRRKDGREIKYQELPSGALWIDFGDGEKGMATQSKGVRGAPRLHIDHPRCGGQVQRPKPEFLQALVAKVAFQDAMRELERKANELVRATIGEGATVEPNKRRFREIDLGAFSAPRAVDPGEFGLEASDSRSMRPGEEKPFFWSSEIAYSIINETEWTQAEKANAKLTFIAHCCISNRVGSALYECHRAHVQVVASLGRTTLWKAENHLEQIDLLTVFRRKEEGKKENRLNCYMLRPSRLKVIQIMNDPPFKSGMGVIPNTKDTSSQSDTTPRSECGQSNKKEAAKNEEEGAPTPSSLDDFFAATAAAEHPGWNCKRWTAGQLKRQWELYSEKGKRGGKWDAERTHFLAAWMPKAALPEGEARKPAGVLRSNPDPAGWQEYTGERGVSIPFSNAPRSLRDEFKNWKTRHE